MIYFDKVSKIYSDDSIALADVSLTIEPKEFVSIVGHSGAGKTTLIKMILAEEKPTEGRVMLHDTDVHSLSDKAINFIRRKIGAVFQDFRLLPHKNVYENIGSKFENDSGGHFYTR